MSEPLIARSLLYLEDRLDPAVFFRANRRHIVNLRTVDAVEPTLSGGLRIILNNGSIAEMSRRRSLAFRVRHNL